MPVAEHPQRTRTSTSIVRHVRRGPAGDLTTVKHASRVLVSSFHEQPHFVDLFPEPTVRTRALPHVFAALLADARQHGRIETISSNGTLTGVAVWYPPDAYPLSVGRQLRALPAMLRLAVAAPRSLRRVWQFQGASSRLHPSEPYHYLAAIGVDPAVQGTGVGSELLSMGLAHADATGQPCYLETHTIRNVDWYRAHGFEVRAAEIAFTPGGPPNWTMYRPGVQR